ncbi:MULTISPECIES: AMP-binding protein [Pseudonocardia]|uniref:Long-chain-fatty-acid--CoA ligase n=2 Tax=Pseudonocardia TaxID=1847 RepID=A0A1Y2MRU1_PSEAH|nr:MULTISPECIES: AMP-binding protein [Pseudonocardia]OSY37933.1 Long-chain-fatty-acid--CoA ligase [Pseudonocardia autotrophica]TDN74594.1 acyl-CoA synthetase (AMP-forming)/AMP-acid ligase II [Pseudonocardia autotrophica]BBG05364.1 AMP-dependent acyl-CoA synthetase [Pseudonocardia autotrophica]GEC29010.1 AMP-dependent acyl-CoA synthetase [Pseudonocardia saturnea]
MRVIDYIDKGADRDPDRPLIVTDSTIITHGEARAASWRYAAGLHAAGLQVGDAVGVLAPNCPEAVLAMWGLWRAGGAWVPLNPLNSLSATLDFANTVDCRWLFLHSAFAADVDRIRAAVPGVRAVVALDRPFPGATSMTDFLAAGAGTTVPDWDDPFGSPDVTCALWPTGGTTGKSKAVRFPNSVWAALTETATRDWSITEHPVNLAVAPMTHAAGGVAVIYASVGATIILRPGFDADDVLTQIEKHRVTTVFLPPTAYYGVLDQQRTKPRDCSSLQMLLLAAAPVSPERLGQGVELFGPCIAQCWGQAESPMVLTWLSPSDVAAAVAGDHPERLASCGRPTFSSRVAVMAEDGRLLPAGERGELVARGALVAPEYLHQADETAAIRRFGWHHTGDIGYIDDDGFVYIVDRLKEMIITGGFNVYPAEVEAALLRLDGVRGCAVVGAPDPKWGEAVVAFVVPNEPDAVDPDSVIGAVREMLGPIKTPKRIMFVDRLPQTPVGKIDKKAIRAELWAGLERAL